MAQVTINLSRPIRLNLDVDESKRAAQSHGLTDVLDLPAGVQDVDEVVAAHWFVKANCEPLPEAQPADAGGEQGGDQGDQGGDSTAKKPAKKPAE